MNDFYSKRGSKGKKNSPSGLKSTEGSQPSATGREQSAPDQQMVSHLLSLKSVRKAKVSNKACSDFVSAATALLGVFRGSGQSQEHALSQVVKLASERMFPKKTLPKDVENHCREMVNRKYINTYVTEPKKKAISKSKNKPIRTIDAKAESLQSKFVAKLPGNPSKEQKNIVEQSLRQLVEWRDLNVKQSQAEKDTLVFVKDKISKSDFPDIDLNSYCNSMVSEVYAQAASKQELQASAIEVTKALDKKEMEIQISTKMVKRGVEAGVRQAIQEAREKKTSQKEGLNKGLKQSLHEAEKKEGPETREKSGQVEAGAPDPTKSAKETEKEAEEGTAKEISKGTAKEIEKEAEEGTAKETAKQASMSPSAQDVTHEQEFEKQNADLLTILGIDQSGNDIVNEKDGGSNQPKTHPAKKTTFMSRLANWWSWLRGSFLSLIGKSEKDKATDSHPIYEDDHLGQVPHLHPNSTEMAKGSHKGKGAEAVDAKKEDEDKGADRSVGKDMNDDRHNPTGRDETVAEEKNDADDDHPAPR